MRALAFILALSLAACMQDGAPPASSALWGTSWIAQSIDGKAVSPAGAISLTFETNAAWGTGGCNSYRGSVMIKGAEIKFGNLASTLMACLEPGRMEQEGAYTSLLRDAARFERSSNDRLDIIATDGRRIAFTIKR
jgi:heat shock protein HslJ